MHRQDIRSGREQDKEQAKILKEVGTTKEVVVKDKVTPNRQDARRAGANRKPFTGPGPGRLRSSQRGTPASFHTHIAIHQHNAAGTIKKMIVPREMYDAGE